MRAAGLAGVTRRTTATDPSNKDGSTPSSLLAGAASRPVCGPPPAGRSCFDNAITESFFASLECELIDRRAFRIEPEAERTVFTSIEEFCNPRRRHSANGQLGPAEYERRQVLKNTQKTVMLLYTQNLTYLLNRTARDRCERLPPRKVDQ
jgi:hypothetical protein